MAPDIEEERVNGRRCIATGCWIAGLVLAATASAKDADAHSYWLGFAENYGADIRLSLLIDAAAPTSGTVEIPGLGFSTRFTATAAATTTIELPLEAMARPGKPAPLGVRVRADGEVIVRGLNHRQSSSDAFLALPLAVLGREYRGLGYTQLRPDQPSQLLVVATHDGTQLKIEARNDCPAADVRLNRGQVWLYCCADVSGLHLQATQPVAVFGGARCAEVPLGQAFCGHLVEQLPPVGAWGQRFAVLPLATRKGSDQVRVLSHEDDNEVRIDGARVATLAAGQVHQLTLARPMLIETGKPALVAQYAASGEADGAEGDPFMTLGAGGHPVRGAADRQRAVTERRCRSRIRTGVRQPSPQHRVAGGSCCEPAGRWSSCGRQAVRADRRRQPARRGAAADAGASLTGS